MKYIVIDERKDGTGDVFSKEFSEAAAAIEEAKNQYSYFNLNAKKERTIYVLKSANPDEDAPDHFDGSYIWKCEG